MTITEHFIVEFRGFNLRFCRIQENINTKRLKRGKYWGFLVYSSEFSYKKA